MSTRRALALAIFVLGVGAAPPAAAEWRRIDSPNFVVIGDVSARTLRSVAIEFEGFRETLTRVMTERATSTPVPTIVIVFPSDRAFTPFKPLYQGKPVPSAGLFVGRQDANYIAVVTEGDVDRMRIVFHEYAHLVISNVMRHVPAWLNEGLAEFYSTYQLRGGREAVLGRVIPLSPAATPGNTFAEARRSPQRRSPVSPVQRKGSPVGLLRAIVGAHALDSSQPAGQDEGTLFAYLDRVSEGGQPMAAWKEAFGAANVERELEVYVRQHSFQAVLYTFSEKLARFEATATPLAAADAEVFLAEFLLQMGRQEETAARLAWTAQAGASCVPHLAQRSGVGEREDCRGGRVSAEVVQGDDRRVTLPEAARIPRS